MVLKKAKLYINKKTMNALKKIKKEYNPDKLIVFGSTARGDTHEGSDIDLIVIKDSKKGFMARITDVLKIYNGNTPIDVFVYTPEEIAKMKVWNSFIKKALKEGVAI